MRTNEDCNSHLEKENRKQEAMLVQQSEISGQIESLKSTEIDELQIEKKKITKAEDKEEEKSKK